LEEDTDITIILMKVVAKDWVKAGVLATAEDMVAIMAEAMARAVIAFVPNAAKKYRIKPA
jgi:hypothetical protein